MTSNDLHWYVGFVKSCQEKKVAEALARMGIDHYLPIRKVKRKWSDRYKIVDTLVLPRFVFVHSTEQRRLETLKSIYGLYGYLNSGGPYHPAIVPDSQMTAFRMMVERGEEKVEVSTVEVAPGDHVRVISGPLKGLECELVRVNDKSCIAVRLGPAGTATMELSVSSLEKIEG